jgi:hypothetical protein
MGKVEQNRMIQYWCQNSIRKKYTYMHTHAVMYLVASPPPPVGPLLLQHNWHWNTGTDFSNLSQHNCVCLYLLMCPPDVPGFVLDVLQTEQLRDFDWRHGFSQVTLISKEQHRHPPTADVWREQEHQRTSEETLSVCLSFSPSLPLLLSLFLSLFLTVSFSYLGDWEEYQVPLWQRPFVTRLHYRWQIWSRDFLCGHHNRKQCHQQGIGGSTG